MSAKSTNERLLAKSIWLNDELRKAKSNARKQLLEDCLGRSQYATDAFRRLITVRDACDERVRNRLQENEARVKEFQEQVQESIDDPMSSDLSALSLGFGQSMMDYLVLLSKRQYQSIAKSQDVVVALLFDVLTSVDEERWLADIKALMILGVALSPAGQILSVVQAAESMSRRRRSRGGEADEYFLAEERYLARLNIWIALCELKSLELERVFNLPQR